MSTSNSPELSPPHSLPETLVTGDRDISPDLASISPSLPEASASDSQFLSPQDQRNDAHSTKADSASSSKFKKKFNELDLRGAMADLDLRKGGKRTGIEDFYIQLDEPHRMFWCPGEVVKGTTIPIMC
jgi:hypothetical protein